MTFDNQLIGHDKYVSVVGGNRKYLIEDFQTLEGCFVFATKSSTLALKDLISKDYYSFESFENNNYIVFEDGFPIDEFVYFKILSPMEIISIPFTFDKISSITPNALNANFKAFEDLCVVMQGLLNERVLRIDKTNSDCMLPELEANEVWKRTEDGKGWEGYDLTLIERTIQEFWDKLYEETRRITEEFRKELGDYTEELKKELNNEGLKLLVNSPNHGFLFDAVQYTSDGKYVKADVNNFADGIAERIDDDNFYLVSDGKITIPAGAKDSSGNDFIEDNYYFLDTKVAGGITRTKPTDYFQTLLFVAKDKGKLRALIEVGTPVDLQPRIMNDFFDEQVERVVNTADEKIEEIKTTQGMKGDKGDKGDTGAVGPQGIQGIQGIQGNVGPQGPQGLKGDKGDQGIQGIQGVKGDTGIQGPIGPQGDKGDKGEAGSLVNIANNEEISLWLGTTADYEAIVEKSKGVLYQHFDEDGNFAGGYYKRLLTPPTRGLVDWYEFSDGKGTETTLKSRLSDNVLTLTNFNFDENSGWTGKGLKFDGVNDKVTVNVERAVAELYSGGALTFVFTYIKQSVASWVPVVRLNTGSTQAQIQLLNDFKLNIYSGGTNNAIDSKALTEVALVFEKDKNLVSVYGDGVFVRSVNVNIELLFPESLKTIELNTTQNSYCKNNNNSFKIYNVALTPEEIAQNYEYEQSIDRTIPSTYPLLQEELSYGIGNVERLSEEQKASFRLSLDGTKFVAGLRYCEGLEVEEFTYSEIQKEMEKEEWSKIEEV